MDKQKILNTEEIDWYEEEENRLDYEAVFGGNGQQKDKDKTEKSSEASETSEEQQVDVKKLIQKRNEKWEKRLRKARTEAFRKGRKQGRKEGYQKAEKEIDDKISQLENLIQKAHNDWARRHQTINPGLLDMAFNMVEKIVGLPVENPEIRERLEEELSLLLHDIDKEARPLLWVSEKDYQFVEELVEEYAPELSLSIRISEDCNPGEFEFETKKETIVHSFREKLNELKENLSLPSWK